MEGWVQGKARHVAARRQVEVLLHVRMGQKVGEPRQQRRPQTGFERRADINRPEDVERVTERLPQSSRELVRPIRAGCNGVSGELAPPAHGGGQADYCPRVQAERVAQHAAPAK
jgi:hypothetical protein